MKTTTFSSCLLACAVGLIITLYSCSKDNFTPSSAFEEEITTLQSGTNENAVTDRAKPVHHVSVGGADICVDFTMPLPGDHPGCDGNFSLVANMDADGNVTGQYTDQFGHGNGGFHATVNCLSVVGNEAWVSGVITTGNIQGFDLAGFPVITRVQDNGKSGDKISFSWIGDPTNCNVQFQYPLFGMTGQVKVW